MAQVPWDDARKHAFLAFQFNAQHQTYRERFPDAAYDVVLDGDAPVGRLYVDRRDDEIRILDIALLPEHQGRGIGRAVLKDLLAEAEAADKSVCIFVETYQQRAQALFGDLGFVQKEDHGISVLMEWRPETKGEAVRGLP